VTEHPKTKIAVEFLTKMMEYLKKYHARTLLEEIQHNAEKENEEIDPFRVLISTVLSVRNRDESTHIATINLFENGGLNTPEKIRDAPIEEIEDLIRKSGMYKTKAQNIKKISQILLDKHDGDVPKKMDDLLMLPGVGRKVANCVLVYAYKEPAIPVDTHVHRISNRTGLISTSKPDDTEKKLMQIYPKKYWLDVNNTFVLFGKTTCKPIGPLCDECPITYDCPKIIIKTPTKKKK
jgi:endonuclease-3